MKTYITFSLLALSFSLGGCATNDNTADDELAYFEAVKEEAKKPLPVPVTKTRVVPTPGQLRPIPPKNPPKEHPHGHRPATIIETANHSARQAPDDHGYYNAIMTYDYDPGALYRLYAAPLQLTDIQLQPGERMISQPAAGDTTRWKVAASLSMEDGVERQHLLITPKRPHIYTSLVIATDRRTYHLELYANKTTYMAAINWNYSEDTITSFELERSDVERTNAQIDTAKISLNDVNFGYQVKVAKGSPDWTPTRAFDNGTKTFIQFPDALALSDAPALYVKKYGQQQIVNYRSAGKYYVVDGIFARLELRVGGKKQQDVVEVINEDIKRPRSNKPKPRARPTERRS